MSADQHDRDALERMLAASLRARSGDVEPTPELWHRVETKVNRSRKFSIAAWTAGVAVAALVGVTVIPNLLPDNDQGPVIQDPTPGPTSGPVSGMPDTIVATDGSRFWLADARTGEELRELFALNPEGEGTVRTFTVHPASTVDDLTVVWVNSAEGMLDLKWFRARTGQESSFGELAYLGADDGGEAPLPRFSEDGAELAWFGQVRGQTGVDPQAGPGINAATWDPEGETTSPIGATSAREIVTDGFARVEAFENGTVTVTSRDLRTLRIDFRGHDASAPWSEPEEVDGGETGALIDIAEVAGDKGYVLHARGEGQGDTRFTLTRASADGPSTVVLEEVHQTNSPGDAWIEALDDGVIFHRVGTTSTLHAPTGEAFEDLVGIEYAAFLPTNRGSGDPTPGATATATPQPTGAHPAIAVVDGDTGDVTVEQDGEVLYTLFEGGSSEFRPSGVSVMSGSSTDYLSAVVWLAGEGVSEFWQLGIVDGEVQEPIRFPDTFQPSAGLDTQSMRAPLFLALGTKLGWVEYTTDGACSLRVIGWEGGPGTGRTADDNTSFGLDGCAEGATLEDAQLGDFDGNDSARGLLTFAVDLANDPDGIREPMNTLTLEYEIQGDGAFALPSGSQLSGEPGHGAWSLAQNGSASLVNVSTPSGRDLVLSGVQDEAVSLPEGFTLLEDGFQAWMMAANGRGAIVFGDGTGAAWVYLYTTGTFVQVGAGGAGEGPMGRAVRHADVVE